MPDSRKHRGKHPSDDKLFAPDQHSTLRNAVYDLSYLLTRGFSETAALKTVGDRYRLTQRQRLAVQRASCPQQALNQRLHSQLDLEDLAGQTIAIDGYNQLIALESALGNAYLFIGRDGCYRDLASLHGTYRKVEETIPALQLLGTILNQLQIQRAIIYLDAPVSNSRRLQSLMMELAKENQWNWQVEVQLQPDPLLARAPYPVITTDSWILDRCHQWANLFPTVLQMAQLSPPIVDLQIRQVCAAEPF